MIIARRDLTLRRGKRKVKIPVRIHAPVRGRSVAPWKCRYSIGWPGDTQRRESYGHDLVTGGGVTDTEYRAQQPAGRAFLRSAHFQPPSEPPDDEYGDIVLGGGEPDQLPHDVDTDRLGRVGGHRVAELLDVVVDDDVSPLDQPVGVEAEHGAGRQRHVGAVARAFGLDT